MRTAKRLVQALLVRFAGMVCPAGAVSAATYLFRTVRRPAPAFLVRVESVGFPGPSGSGFAAIDGCRSGGRLPGGGVDRAPSRTLAEPGNFHFAVLERSALAT